MAQATYRYTRDHSRRWLPQTLGMLAAAVLFASASTVDGKQTPEQKCQKGRYDAAAKYSQCQQKAMGKYYGGGELWKYLKAVGTCAAK